MLNHLEEIYKRYGIKYNIFRKEGINDTDSIETYLKYKGYYRRIEIFKIEIGELKLYVHGVNRIFFYFPQKENSVYNHNLNMVFNKTTIEQFEMDIKDFYILFDYGAVLVNKIPTIIFCGLKIENSKLYVEIMIGSSDVLRITSTYKNDDILVQMCKDYIYCDEKQENLQFLDYIQDNYPESDIGKILC